MWIPKFPLHPALNQNVAIKQWMVRSRGKNQNIKKFWYGIWIIYRKVIIAPDYICLWIKPKCSLNRMMAFTQFHQWATILRFLPSIWFLQRRKYCLWLDVILQKGHQSMPPYLTFYGSRIISNIWSLHLPIISLLATNNTICLIFHLSNFGRKGKGECHKTKKSKKSFL